MQTPGNCFIRSGDTTPVSSSSVTPVITKRPVSEDILKTPPLFSPEKREMMAREKDQLQTEIAVLNQRLLTLQTESKNLKLNRVSIPELVNLKSEVRLRMSESNQAALDNLTEEYIENIRAMRELEATCERFTEMIRQESQERERIVQRSAEISEIFDFSEFKLTLPVLPDAVEKIDTSFNLQLTSLEKATRNLKSEQMKLDQVKPPSHVISDAASAVSRKAETEWQLRSLGNSLLRAQIQSLQRQLADSDSDVRKMENSKIDAETKLCMLREEHRTHETRVAADVGAATKQFNRTIEEMEEEIMGLKAQISESDRRYEAIQRSIERISDEGIISDEEDEEEEWSDSSEESDLPKRELVIQKQVLITDVEQLKLRLRKEKSNIINKESKAKAVINELYQQYLKNKRCVVKNQNAYNGVCQSPVDKDIDTLMRRINTSIVQLRDLAL